MNITNCKEVLENTKQYPLYSVVVFWKSPLSHEVEYCEAYFTQYYEAYSWATDKTNFYEKINVPFATYINTNLYKAKGDLFDD